MLNIVFRHYKIQQANPSALWKLPTGFSVVYANLQNEVVVSGVFLRLFIANPAWVLRRPKEFLGELLNSCVEQMNKERMDVSKI